MAIKINGKDLSKRIINWHEVEKVIRNGVQIRPESTPPAFDDYLNFYVMNPWSFEKRVKLDWPNSGVSFEISNDKVNWTDYTLWTYITLTQAPWGFPIPLYFRNKSETPVALSTLSSQFRFSFDKRWDADIAVEWNLSSLLCKYGTDLTYPYCFSHLFYECAIYISRGITFPNTVSEWCYESTFEGNYASTLPSLPATSLARWCYYRMFARCVDPRWHVTEWIALPATSLPEWCYWEMFEQSDIGQIPSIRATTISSMSCYQMFNGCSNIKLSETQTWDYQNPYRIPSSGTGVAQSDSFSQMFFDTGWTFTWTPSINQTYYTSNTVI